MKSLGESTMPSNIASADPAAEFSPAPLLDAFENFQGSFFDLDRNVRISAGTLKHLKTELHSQMARHGLTAGDRVIAALPNGPLFAAVWAATLEAGAASILVHSDTPQSELDRMAAQWSAEFLITEAVTGRQNNETRSQSFSAGEHGMARWQRVENRNARCDAIRLSSVPLHPTSGTSAGPKLAVRPGPCAVAEPLHYIETLAINRSDAILCAIPMSHAYGYGMCFMVPLLTSADLLFTRHFNPALVHQALHQMSISIFPAVPFILDSLLAVDVAHPVKPPRIVLSAGAPLTRKTFDAFRHRYKLAVRPLYGTTETGGISIASAEDEFDGGVGPAMAGVEVALRPAGVDDSDQAKILRVRSASMMAGYLESGAINRNYVADGWFETGDLAQIDARGRIHLLGRLSEVINVFGLKVIPREVEEVIALLPGVAEVKVYARRDMGSEVVEAAVVCRGSLDEGKILKHCEKHLVSYKCPTAIRFVSALPRTASGKIAVEQLAK
jgi:acyl-coenzyme A synthetase/AMP-(fatty) acid ligase